MPNTKTAEPEVAGANEPWSPPTSEQEFVFKDMASAPAWVDRGWASYDAGPALAVPAGDLYGTGPYTTKTARVGDTVKFTPAVGATPAKFTIIPGEPDPAKGGTTRKPAQVTNASLEDLVKQGYMSPDELGDDAKAQVAARSPGLRPMIEGKTPAPKAQKVSDIVKV